MMSRIYLMIVCMVQAVAVCSQAIDPNRSAQALANADNRFIASSIEDNKAFMFLSQKGKDNANDERVKTLADQMLQDNTAMLYSMEQLATAGSGSAERSAGSATNQQAVSVNKKLAVQSGMDFDTLWTSSLLSMLQAKYTELINARETVANPRLKMAVVEAIPMVKKDLSQLKTIQKYLERMIKEKKRADAAK